MSEKSDDILEVTPERLAEAWAWLAPERLGALDSMTDDDIVAQIAANPDAAPELYDAWIARAQMVTPLKRSG